MNKKTRMKIALIIIGVFIVSAGLGFYLEWKEIVKEALTWLGLVGMSYIAGDSHRKSGENVS